MTVTRAADPGAAVAGPGRRPWRDGVAAVGGPALLSLVLSLAWSWRPSYWQDEAFTLSATSRPLTSLPHLLRDVDAVHGLYYALLNGWVHVSTAAGWVRAPSGLATAVTAGLVVVLGWQLVDRRLGVVAGLIFAVLPISSYYGAEARGYALAGMLGVASTVTAVAAAQRGARRLWVVYATLVATAGYAFLFTVLVVAAHGVWLLAERRRRRVLVRWVGATASAGVTLLPLAAVGSRQAAFQINWINRPDADSVAQSWRVWFSGSLLLALVIWTLVLVAVVAAVRAGRRGAGLSLVVMAGGIAVLPLALLISLSAVQPVYTPRYVEASAVGFALLAGYALTRLQGQRAALAGALAGVAVVAVLGVPAQVLQRRPAGHGDTQADLAARLRSEQRAGDGVFYAPTYWRVSAAAYPASFRRLADPTLSADPIRNGDFIGGVATPQLLRARLAGVDRIWWWHRDGLPGPNTDASRELEVVRAAGFQVVEHHDGAETDLELLQRDPRR